MRFARSVFTIKASTTVTNFSHCDVVSNEIDAARMEADRSKQRVLWAQVQKKIIAQVCAMQMLEAWLVFARQDNLDFGCRLEGSLWLGPQITDATHFE